MSRLVSSLLILLSFVGACAACASAQARQRRNTPPAGGQRTVSSSRFPGANVCAKIQAAIDSLGPAGGTVTADAAGDCGDRTQVRVRAGVTLRLPPGTFTYSMRGYGGANNSVGALFLLDSDSTLEGSGPSTVIRESSWVHTLLSEAEQKGVYINGEYIATFKVIMPTAVARNIGSTARNIVVRNLKVARGKPDAGPASFNSSGGALDVGNCHNCLIEGVHMERTRSIGIHVGGAPQGGQDPGFDLAERGVTAPLGRTADGVVVRNCFFDGVASQNLALVNGRNVVFESNRFVRPGQPGGPGPTMIDLEPNHPDDYLENVRIVGNHLSGLGSAIPIAGNGIVVQATSGTVRVGPILVEGNEIIGGGMDDWEGTRIRRKIVSNGIYVFGPTMRDVTIRNNRVTFTGQAGINIEGTRINVLDNRLEDVAGGGNPGFRVASVIGSRIEGNVFTYSGDGPADSRILVTGNSRDNIIRNNRGFTPPEHSR
jgi:hypothetical protein